MSRTHTRLKTALFAALLGSTALVSFAVPAFPGAAGFGSATVGGRGPVGSTPTIYVVDKLSDSATPQQGEFRHGVENTTGPRIIVFKVAGTIELTRVIRIRKDRPYITIAGQTAPPPGITLKNAGIDVQTHDVVVQHIAIRPGARRNNVAPWTGLQGYGNRKAILINPVVDAGESVYNVVFDHVSVSWGTDENITISGSNNPVYDITFSNSFNYEALRFCGKIGDPAAGAYLGHPDVYQVNQSTGWIEKTTGLDERDGHSAGFYVFKGGRNVSLARNVFAFNRWRNPMIAAVNPAKTGYPSAPSRDVRIVNNFIYAPGQSNGHRMIIGAQSPANTGTTTVSADGNITVLHPDPTPFPVFANAEGIPHYAASTATTVFRTDSAGPNIINLFLNNNRLYHPTSGWVTSTPPYNTTIFSEGRAVNEVGETLSDGVSLFSSGWTETQVRDELLAKSGARPLVRDLHDRRLVSQIKAGQVRDWTDFPRQSLDESSFATHIDTAELDADGYPKAIGNHDPSLTLVQVTSPHADPDADGWTNIEEWIHAWGKFVESTPSGTLSPETPKLDNFEDGTTTDWTTSGGAWALALVGAANTPEHNTVYAQTNNATTARAILGGTNWAYQTVQADITPTSFGSSTYSFGVVGRYRDASNHYHLVLRNGNVFELRRVVGGTSTVMQGASSAFTAAISYPVAANTTYRLTLVLDGPQIIGRVRTWNPTTFTWSAAVQILGFDYNPIANGSAGLGMTNAATQNNCVLATPSLQERVIVAQDFESGATGWTSAGTANWAIVSDGSMVYRQTNLTGGAATFADKSVPDQMVEGEVCFLSVDGADRWIGLMARYTDESNYYYTTLRSNGASSRIALKKIVAGTVAADLDSANYPVTVPATYQMRLEVVGTSLNAYIGDRRVLEAQDASLTSGKQGVRMYKATAQFDDFVVTAPRN